MMVMKIGGAVVGVDVVVGVVVGVVVVRVRVAAPAAGLEGTGIDSAVGYVTLLEELH